MLPIEFITHRPTSSTVDDLKSIASEETANEKVIGLQPRYDDQDSEEYPDYEKKHGPEKAKKVGIEKRCLSQEWCTLFND